MKLQVGGFSSGAGLACLSGETWHVWLLMRRPFWGFGWTADCLGNSGLQLGPLAMVVRSP